MESKIPFTGIDPVLGIGLTYFYQCPKMKAMQLSKDQIQRLTQNLQAYEQITLAILYGSQAQGTAGVDSDLDLGIFGKQELGTDFLIELSLSLEKMFGLPVQIRDLQKARGLFLNQILGKGEVLFCKDDQKLTDLIIQNLDYMSHVFPAYEKEAMKQNRMYFIG